jgi:hypothetical protein
MRSRYKGGAGRAAALAALAVSGVLAAQTLNLNPGSYQLVMTPQRLPQAAGASSPDMLKSQMHQVCIAETNPAQGRDSALAQARELAGEAGDRSCRVSDLTSSGNQMRFVVKCAHTTMRFDGFFATNSYRATLLMTSEQGQTTTVSLTARRTGNCTNTR